MSKKNLFLIQMLLPFFLFAQQPNTAIDVQHYSFSISLNDSNNIIKGTAIIAIRFLKDAPLLSLDLANENADGKGMTVRDVKQDQKEISFYQDAQHLLINAPVKSGDTSSFTIMYEGIPADGLIISKNEFGNRTFFSDNWPNRAHNWIPCNDHLSDKASVEFIVTAPDHYQVISNGIQTEETNLPHHLKLTRWEETKDLPTKIMVIGVADFAVNFAGNVNDIPVYSWVYPESRDTGFVSYARAKDILPFFISKVGPYAYKKLANVQSKTIFGGMENASAIFYFEHSVGDKNIEALLAHEIAHQWFGDAATEKNWQHLWLSEGFATYMTHLYHEHKYGTDSLKKRMAEDRKRVIEFSAERNTPVVDTSYGNDLMQLLNANSYQKGGWVLHMLRRKLGDTIFWKGIRNYYAQYAGKNANTENLKNVFEKTSGESLDLFFKQWLYTPGQPQLNIEWKYNRAKKEVSITVTQEQNIIFEFPLQFAFKEGGKIESINIKNKITSLNVKAAEKPTTLIIDPDVNLLYKSEIKEMK
jgi:aminopeptidase N